MTETRAEKAQRLVDEGRVEIQDLTEHRIRTTIAGSVGNYPVILYPNGHYFCLCNWGRFHSHTDDLCAHALAVKLMTEKENKP